MAKIQGGVPVAGFMSPTDDQDVYAVTKEEYNQGGYRSVATVDEMNAITSERRKEGMLVNVINENKIYQLVNDVFKVTSIGEVLDYSDFISKYDNTKTYKVNDIIYNIADVDNKSVVSIYVVTAAINPGETLILPDPEDNTVVPNVSLITSSDTVETILQISTSLENLKEYIDTLKNKDTTGEGLTVFKGLLGSKTELDALTDSKVSDIYLVGDDSSGYVSYIYVKKEDNSKEWIKLGGGGSDSNGTYTNTTPTPVVIGGVPAGTTFNDVPITDVFNMLFYPYQPPAFTQFSVNKTQYEIGESTGTQLMLSWNTSNQANIQPNSVVITFNNTEIGANLANSGTNQTFTITETTKNVPGTVPVKIELTNTKNEKANRTVNLEWLHSIYYGVSALDTITGVASFTKINTNTIARTYNFAAGGYKYLVYPSSIADCIEWKDESTNLQVPFEKLTNLNLTNQHGAQIEYKVFRTLNVLGGSIKIIVK